MVEDDDSKNVDRGSHADSQGQGKGSSYGSRGGQKKSGNLKKRTYEVYEQGKLDSHRSAETKSTTMT
jgi:hypothetical protein